MKWITRERPKIDRIACPWLIERFIDPTAEFLFVPADQVIAQAQATGAIPYDVPGVQLTHVGDKCSFDTFIEVYKIDDAAVKRLAVIVRGADTDRHHLAPQCAGLLAISLGLGKVFTDDHVLLNHGKTMYDALYAWCRELEAGRIERHGWDFPS